MQIDELSHSKETLERSAFTLLEEIKVLKGKVDMEAMNLNAISGDMRNKTRKLEDENRAHVRVKQLNISKFRRLDTKNSILLVAN